MSARRWFGVLAALALLTSACSADPEISPPASADPTSTTLGNLLASVPTGPGGSMFVTATSLSAIEDRVVVGRECGSTDAVTDWISRSYAQQIEIVPVIPELVQRAPIGDRRLVDEFGVSLCDIEWIVESEVGQPGSWFVNGDFDGDVVDEAIRADEVWGNAFTIDMSTDVEVYDWGEELDIERRTTFRPLGIGGHFVVLPGEGNGRDVAAYSRERSTMLDVIDAGSRSVVADPDVAIALPILTATNPIAVVMTNEIPRWSDISVFTDDPGLLEAPDWALAPYRLIGAAESADAEGAFLEVVLVHRSALDAEENLGRLQSMFTRGTSIVTDTPWSDLLTIESVGARDATVIVRLRTTEDVRAPGASILLRSLFSRDTLFVSS